MSGFSQLNPLPVAVGGTGDTGTAFTQTTPAPGSGGGTLTTASSDVRAKTLGKIGVMDITITITTVGSASLWLTLVIPFTPARSGAMVFSSGTNTAMFVGQISAAVATINVVKYDGTFGVTSGSVLTGSWAGEIQ